MSGRLDGRRALIVGASRGIGRTIAAVFAAEGASLFLVGRSEERLEAAAAEVRVGGAGAVATLSADIANASSATGAVEKAAVELGGLDVVVNSAAVHNEWGRIGELSVETWDETIAINLSGTFYICRAALPVMVDGGGGTIVNITSVAGHRAWQTVGPYNASKAGVELLTRTIAVEYAADGIRANCIAPGVVDAGISDDVLARDPSLREPTEALHPLGRFGEAEEVAEATVWLASDQSSFTTGSTLGVDGGFLA